MPDVSTPSPEYNKAIARSELCRTLMQGTRGMRRAGGKYLPKFMAESEQNHHNRVHRSVLFNAYKSTVAQMTGKIFSKPVVLSSDVPERISEYAENVDLTGRNLNVFARDCFYDGLQTGIGFILVDMHRAVVRTDGMPATRADENAAGLRPFLVYVALENLIGWKSEQVAGVETLTMVRIRECVSVPDGDYAEKDIEQIRVLTPGTWQTWRKSETDLATWVIFEEGTMALNKIPLAPVYLNRTGFMCGAPPLEELADLNLCHFQSSSDQRNILTVARVPILFGTGFDAETVIEIGASNCIRNSNPAAKLEYVEHSGQAIGAGAADLEDLISQMEAFGLQLLVDKPGGKTATGEVRDDARENSQLASMAAALQDALEHALSFMAEFIGLGEDAGGSCVVNQNFGVASGWGDAQQLLAARVAGEISRETYWSEMQRRGFLSDDFDPEVEADRIASEMPSFHAAPTMNLDHTH
jgi:Domain of unknown function (DUF4055)